MVPSPVELEHLQKVQGQEQGGVIDIYPSIKCLLQVRMGTEMDESNGWQLSSLIFQKPWATFGVIGNVLKSQFNLSGSKRYSQMPTLSGYTVIYYLSFQCYAHPALQHLEKKSVIEEIFGINFEWIQWLGFPALVNSYPQSCLWEITYFLCT